jgi:hypothetical protein
MAAKGQAYWPLESEILFLKNKHLPLAHADQVAAEIVELGAVGRKIAKRFSLKPLLFFQCSSFECGSLLREWS